MRELIFKNLTSNDKRRKDIFISEVVEKGDVKTFTKRHSTYIISNHTRFNNHKELIDWQSNAAVGRNNRHIFIFKKRNTKSRKDSFICDVVGKFYAVLKNDVYSVAFKHCFEVDFQTLQRE